MKNQSAIFCALFSVALLTAFSAGCGGSGSSEKMTSASTQASLVGSGSNRGIRVSWKALELDPTKYTIIQYQIMRSSSTAAGQTLFLVGVTSPDTTSLVDTMQDRDVTYIRPNATDAACPGSNALATSVEKTPGLASGTHIYTIYVTYRNNITPPNDDPSDDITCGFYTTETLPTLRAEPILFK